MNAIKKLTLFILCLVLLFTAIFGFTSCKAEEPEECSHSWDNWEVIVSPTCQSEGLERRVCKLDSSHTEEQAIDKLSHSFGSYASNGNASCSQNGTKTAHCTTLGCTVTDTIEDAGSKLAHTFDQKVTTDKYLKSKASCTQKASYYFSCSCGAIGTEAFEYGEIAHSYPDEWASDKTNHWNECENCQNKKDIEVHEWDNGITEREVSCTEDGKIVYRCDCGETKETIIPARHTLKHIAEKEATCVAAGNIEYWVCELEDCNKYFCNAEATIEIALHNTITATLEHDYIIWEYTENAHHKKCAHCDAVTADEAHTVENKFDSEYHSTGCSCGYAVYKSAHSIKVKNNETNHWFECSGCAYHSEEIAHNTIWKSNEHEHWNECTVSGCGYVSTSAAHEWDDGVVTTNPTCAEDGVKTFTCVCGKTYTEAVPATSHDFENGKLDYDNANHWRKCAECNEATDSIEAHSIIAYHNETQHWNACSHACGYSEPAALHVWDDGVVTTQPSETSTGEKTFTCACGRQITEIIPATSVQP